MTTPERIERDSAETGSCPHCKSAEILGQVDRHGNFLIRRAGASHD